MTILNFNVTCTVSKKKVMRLEGTTIYHEDKKVKLDKVSGHDAKIIAEALLDKVTLLDKPTRTMLFNCSPEKLVDDVTYLRDIRDMAIQLRRKTSGRGGSKTTSVGDEFESSMTWRCNDVLDDIDLSNLTVPQRVTLSQIMDKNLCIMEFSNYYDVRNDDISELNSLEESLKRMRKGGNYKENLLKNIVNLREKIEQFRKIVDASGDDLINWGQHKISRWLNVNSNKDKPSYDTKRLTYYGILSWIEVIQDKLKAKGIKPTPPKKKSIKPTKSENLEARYKLGEESFTQEELVTLLKKGNNVSHLMELNTIFDMFEEGKKVKVTQKAVTTYDFKLQARMFETITNDKEFTKVWKFYGRDAVVKDSKMSWDDERYLNNFRGQLAISCNKVVEFNHLLSDNLIERYVSNCQQSLDITDELFDKRLKDKFKVDDSREELTHHYIKRMTTKQKEKFLSSYHNFEQTKIKLNKDDHKELLNTLDYTIVKKILLKSFRDSTVEIEELFLNKKDKEGCKFILMKGSLGDYYCTTKDRTVDMFKILSFKDKLDVITQGKKEYYDEFKKIFSKEEDDKILTDVINNWNEKSEAILQHYMGVNNPRPHLELILSLKFDGLIPTTTELLDCLNKTKKLKKDFLSQGHTLDFESLLVRCYTRCNENYMYNTGEEFYNCFTREEILSMAGITDILDHPQSRFLNKFMTWEQKALEADEVREFKVRHAEALGYDYFKRVAHLFDDGMTQDRHRYFKKDAVNNRYSSRGSGLTDPDKAFMRTVKAMLLANK